MSCYVRRNPPSHTHTLIFLSWCQHTIGTEIIILVIWFQCVFLYPKRINYLLTYWYVLSLDRRSIIRVWNLISRHKRLKTHWILHLIGKQIVSINNRHLYFVLYLILGIWFFIPWNVHTTYNLFSRIRLTSYTLSFNDLKKHLPQGKIWTFEFSLSRLFKEPVKKKWLLLIHITLTCFAFFVGLNKRCV